MISLSWLPDKKFYEYAYHKYQNPEVEFASWIPYDQWDYPKKDVDRFEHLIGNQLQHITNKRVLDVACHLGYLSLFCLHNGASHVTGTNVRHRELEISSEVANIAGFRNHSFIYSDIYDRKSFSDLCNNHDTILLSGIIYHVNNHYDVLKTIYQSSARTVIIDSQLDSETESISMPVISWITEETSNPVNGYEDNNAMTFVGIPSKSWIIFALSTLGFNVTYNATIKSTNSLGQPRERCVIVGEK